MAVIQIRLWWIMNKVVLDNVVFSKLSVLHWLVSVGERFKPTKQWASYQIRKIAGCVCAGNVFPRGRLQTKLLASDPGMHHGTCVTHVPWCMSGSLTRCGGETFLAFPAHAHPQIYVSGKRPIGWNSNWINRQSVACPSFSSFMFNILWRMAWILSIIKHCL